MSLSTYKGIRAGHLAERRKRAPTLTQAELIQAYFQLARTDKLQFTKSPADFFHKSAGLLIPQILRSFATQQGIDILLGDAP